MPANISSHILNYKDEILEDIIKLVRIRSVRGEPKDGMPFGEEPAKALAFCLDLARNMGFKVKNVDNYAGHIEYGEGDKLIAVLAHVDVVPAGEGWTYPPFGGDVVGDRIYGRGTMDDKGPAISAIYCLKALKDMGFKPKCRIRVILGSAEETGMEDMDYYFKREEMPDYAFSPDGEYPVCNREKGILHATFKASGSGRVVSLIAGNAPNAVPVSAQAELDCTAEQAAAIEKAAAAMEDGKVKFAVVKNVGGNVKISCFGKAAHASTPEDGVNAACYLIRLLATVLKEDAGKLVNFLDEKISLEYTGESFGVACSDAESGPLTLNLGLVHIANGEGNAVIDIRYPVTKKGDDLSGILLQKASEGRVTGVIDGDTPPLYIESSAELIQKLCSAYKTVMKADAATYSTGGGSYARALNNRGVAFGASITSLHDYNIHGADEYLEVEQFMLHCQICLQAIYELAC